MDLNLSATFVRVVEAGSFTAAARLLALPTSSVSRAVSRLEAELGLRLLERTTRRVSPTAAGRAYYDGAASALSALDEAAERASQQRDEPRGVVRVTVPVDADNDLLAEHMMRFSRRHPLIQVEISFSNQRVDLIAEGFDLAVRAGHMPDSRLVARKVGDSEAWLYATPKYLDKHGKPERAADLESHTFVVFRPRTPIAWMLSGPRGSVKLAPTGALHTDNFGFVRRLVLLGAGIGVMPTQICREDLKTRRLVRVLPEYAMRGGGMYLVVPSARHLPLRVSLLRDFLLQAYRNDIT